MTHIPTDTLSRKWHRHLAAKSTIHGAHMGQGWSGCSLNISEFKGKMWRKSSENQLFPVNETIIFPTFPGVSTPPFSQKNGAFHRQRSSPCWAWWSTTVGCSIGATPLSLWHLGAAPGEHGERTWGHGQFVAIDISKISVSISYIYIYVCVFVSETECWHMYIHVIFIELCGLPVLMHIARVDAYWRICC